MPDDQPYSLQRLLDVYPSFVLLAGLRLEVFTGLKDGPLSANQVAAALGGDPRRLQVLLYALVAVGLLKVDKEGYFANTAESASLLVKGRPGYLGGAHALWAQLWEAALRAADSIRTGQPRARHDFAAMPAADLEAFINGLHPDALETGGMLASRPEWAGCHALLDVGGGSGGVSIALCQAHAHLRATVVELPTVAPLTKRFVAEAGLEQRVVVGAVDILSQPLEGPFDAAVLKALLQTLSPDQAQETLMRVAAALRPGASIYILGQGMLDDARCSPREAACFNLALLSLYPEGRAYTESEYRTWLEEAGFTGVERGVLRDGTPLITARKR
ncbi:MAG: methyltransferase domain-containing protein [Candidatus Latescibacteria bacterium]|nr:methyltransferase domain-containing protein [Candidatus Latescibacterota bacterium]